MRLDESLEEARDSWEREYLLQRLEDCQWQISRAALGLKVSRRSLYRRLAMLRIDPKRMRREWERSLENR